MNNENNNCECREDDNCGCTYPNNIRDYNKTKKAEYISRVIKDTTCVCTPTECACSIERTQVDN